MKRSARRQAHVDAMAELQPAVMERAGYRCERCGAGDSWENPLEAHHRLPLGRGGPDTPENLVVLCRLDHQWVHANPVKANAEGLLFHAWEGPPTERWIAPSIRDSGGIE